MLRTEDKRLFIGQPVPTVFAGGKLARRDYLPDCPVTPTLAWYDPSYDAGVLRSGGVIVGLADLTGQGNNLFPASASTVAAASSINGRLAMGFSANERMISDASRSDLTSSSFAVISVSSVAAGSRTILGAAGDGGDQLRLNGATLETLRQGVSVKASQSNASVSANTPVVVGQVIDASGVTQYTNTVSETDLDANAFTNNLVLSVGRRNTVTESFTGAIGEIIMYAETLSGADALSVIGYLSTKWGVT